MQQTSVITTEPSGTRIAARWTFAASGAALILLAALHLLSPEFDPSWRMVSEYALGSYGWVLSLFFLLWALADLALFFTIKSQVQNITGKIGLGFLLLSALGTGMAAFFDVSHGLHGLAAAIGIPTLPIAAMLISVSLLRNPAWSPARGALLWTASLTWLSLILLLGAIYFAISSGAEFGPGMLIGWINRLLIVAYNSWVIAVAWSAVRLQALFPPSL